MAALLAIGPDAALSHRSAAMQWGIRSSARPQVEVIVRRSVRSRLGIQVHSLPIADDEIETIDGIPVTTVSRTIFDLAAVLDRPQVERAWEQARRAGLTSPVSLRGLLHRYPRRSGSKTVRRILAGEGIAAADTRSELERRFLALLGRAGIDHPDVNALLVVGEQRFEVDCVWRERRVVVELDGFAFHGDREAFERDRRRDRVLQAAGWQVVRVTWQQLHERAGDLRRDLGRLLTVNRSVHR